MKEKNIVPSKDIGRYRSSQKNEFIKQKQNVSGYVQLHKTNWLNKMSAHSKL